MYRIANFSLGGPDIRKGSASPGETHTSLRPSGWRLVNCVRDGPLPPTEAGQGSGDLHCQSLRHRQGKRFGEPSSLGLRVKCIAIFAANARSHCAGRACIALCTHVTRYLYSNQLTGEIPTELGNLTKLTALILYDNQLTGEIPSELGSLSNLTRLSLLGGWRADEGHSYRANHRRPCLPQLSLGLPAPDVRPHRPRPPQAGGGTRPQGGAAGCRAGFRHPRPRPQPQSFEARPPGRCQAVGRAGTKTHNVPSTF